MNFLLSGVLGSVFALGAASGNIYGMQRDASKIGISDLTRRNVIFTEEEAKQLNLDGNLIPCCNKITDSNRNRLPMITMRSILEIIRLHPEFDKRFYSTGPGKFITIEGKEKNRYIPVVYYGLFDIYYDESEKEIKARADKKILTCPYLVTIGNDKYISIDHLRLLIENDEDLKQFSNMKVGNYTVLEDESENNINLHVDATKDLEDYLQRAHK